MKKIFFLVVLSGGFCRLQAQQKLPVKPADSLLNGLNKSFNLKQGNTFNPFEPQTNNTAYLNALITSGFTSKTDHMPVVALEGNSKMPVKKIGGYYTMPVKRIGSEDLMPVGRNTLPGMPTLKTP